jgi:hypothetical protein
VTVEILGVSWGLSLAEVLDGAEMVSSNGLHILNDFLYDDSLGVSVLNALVVDSLGCTIE